MDLCETMTASLWLVTYDVCRNWYSERFFLHENRWKFFCTSYLKVSYLAQIPFAKRILITCDDYFRISLVTSFLSHAREEESQFCKDLYRMVSFPLNTMWFPFRCCGCYCALASLSYSLHWHSNITNLSLFWNWPRGSQTRILTDSSTQRSKSKHAPIVIK